MDDPNSSLPPLPVHIEAIVHLMARLRSEHHRTATPIQQAIERFTALVARPRFLGVLVVFIGGWIGASVLADALGYRSFDPAPFFALQGLISLSSLFLVVIILATQRREDQLAHLQEQLNLHLAILNEQKSAKVIKLLEEFRRDDPLLKDRVDQEAQLMAQSANPETVIEAIAGSTEITVTEMLDSNDRNDFKR